MAKKQEPEIGYTAMTAHAAQPSLNLMGQRVKILQIHQATNINGQVKTSIGTKQEAVDMTIVAQGVLLEYKCTRTGLNKRRVVFSNNVYEAELE